MDNTNSNIVLDQVKLCLKYNAIYTEYDEALKVGVSSNLKNGEYPLHGLRHEPTSGTSGWYIWCGEYSESQDFFSPLHTCHLASWRPEIMKYLGLPPGWRFLIATDYEDVWFDASLLA